MCRLECRAWRSAPIKAAWLRLVLREGATLVGLGVLIGVPGIYVAGGLIRGVLVGVSPSDPLTLLAVALALLLVTMATVLCARAAGLGDRSSEAAAAGVTHSLPVRHDRVFMAGAMRLPEQEPFFARRGGKPFIERQDFE